MTDDNLLLPARGTNPSPLRASTVAELEYGQVVLRFGRNKRADWPVYCKMLKIIVPTGRSATDLTGEPSLITYSASPVNGPAQGREWQMVRNSTDPNHTVFSCVPDTTATFDATWQVNFTLSGIEVNESIGTVDLTVEEETSTTGNENDFQLRTGRVEVKKSGSEFYFHSLRPRTVVINRGSTVDLLWEGSSNAQYTMYYRDADGTQTYDNDQSNFAGGLWKSPELHDNANFTLKATINGEDHYLTTSLKVNAPNITVNEVTAQGTLTANGHVNAFSTGKVVRIAELRGPYDGNATPKEKPLVINGDATINVGKTLTANGPIQANQNIIVDPGPTGQYYGLHTAHIWAVDGNADSSVLFKSKVKLEQVLTAEDDLTVEGHLAANGHVTATGSNMVVRVRELRGPVKTENQDVDPPIDISKGTIRVGTIYGTGTYPTLSIPAHLNLSTPGRTTTINGRLAAEGAVQIFGAPTVLLGETDLASSGSVERKYETTTSGFAIGYSWGR